jgi:TolB-like protein
MVNYLEANVKKTILKIIPIILLIMGCSGGPKPVENPANLADNSGGMTLDQALKEAAGRIDERITVGSKIAPLNFNSPHDKFSSYVLDELTANLVDSRKLTVVDRKEVDLIRGEFDFQLSGEVGDDSIQELGRMLGAQTIISGSLTDIGGFYRIVIRVLNVQNASVEVQYRANIVNDSIVTALLTGGKSTNTSMVRSQTEKNYNVFEFMVKYYDDPRLYDCSSIIKIEFINGSSESAPVLDTQTVNLNEGDITKIYSVSGFTQKDRDGKGIFGVKFTFASIPTQFYWSTAQDSDKILIEFIPGMTGDRVVFHKGDW